MRILVVLPNWLGDAVMTTPAIDALVHHFERKDRIVELVLVGSYVSIEALKYHPNCVATFVDETKKASSRVVATFQLAQAIGRADIAITFRNQIHSSLLLAFTRSYKTVARKSLHASLLLNKSVRLDRNKHLVEQYHDLVRSVIGMTTAPTPLKLYIPAEDVEGKKRLGINAGATYGSAKRWYPERFAEVAAHFADEYDIIIFGGANEVEMASDIEKRLVELGVQSVTNIAGKTSIQELCAKIGSLSLFITNDSGPMHIAAAYQVPTVAIFGPTRYKETSQWHNKKSQIARVEVDCAPCMKRECPLPSTSKEYHQCMKKVDVTLVLEAIKKLKLGSL